MEYAATALAILGVAAGIAFRFKVLLPIIGVVLLASIIFSLATGFGFMDTPRQLFSRPANPSHFLSAAAHALGPLVSGLQTCSAGANLYCF